MVEENLSQEFILRNIDETNYFFEQIKQNWWVKSLKRFLQL